jgi:hypothetical protein
MPALRLSKRFATVIARIAKTVGFGCTPSTSNSAFMTLILSVHIWQIIIGNGAPSSALQIVKLFGAKRPEKSSKSEASQTQGQWQEIDKDIHRPSPFIF